MVFIMSIAQGVQYKSLYPPSGRLSADKDNLRQVEGNILAVRFRAEEVGGRGRRIDEHGM